MDTCTLYIILMFVLMFGVPIAICGYADYANKEKIAQAQRDYVNSVKATEGDPNNNQELLQQMKPTDKVVSYIELKYNIPGRVGDGYIAVTHERLIFKAVAVGDHTSSLNNTLANNPKAAAGMNLKFDLKEETCNIPIMKVTSMSRATESFEVNTGCGGGNKEVISAYVLRINAQGLLYNLFLGKNEFIADEFARTFTSMTYEREE